MNEMTKVASEILKNDKGFIGSNKYNVIKVEENYCELEGIISETSYNNISIFCIVKLSCFLYQIRHCLKISFW